MHLLSLFLIIGVASGSAPPTPQTTTSEDQIRLCVMGHSPDVASQMCGGAAALRVCNTLQQSHVLIPAPPCS